ncbi:uncharacterized protein BBA_04217 [Beauveria bassiana ARSEF 2860]|uniref:Uncharacterized protein n=1 Tax=Beauveria bassiana (strain ARSEF 2860) TaxID=655819 RepID=J4KP67_BEAB2|nr:uncharacterized protein BBA_04217 [Beauveria bassiana ARSEF 2860]EJP66924.1 hypothetical protein BBA_04217 [Beauveria bassiana ARSEF 2860]
MAPDALPSAASYSAVSNRISMLFASQSSILKTLNTPSSKRPISSKPSATTTSVHQKTQAELDDDALFANKHPLINEGVGYVAPAANTAETKADRELRGRMLGSRAQQSAAAAEREKWARKKKKKMEEESEDEEELGRSALGKRKRRRGEEKKREEEEEKEESKVKEEKGGDDDVLVAKAEAEVEAETQAVVEEAPQPAEQEIDRIDVLI